MNNCDSDRGNGGSGNSGNSPRGFPPRKPRRETEYPVWERLSVMRGDTFAHAVRVCFGGQAGMLGEGGKVYWALRSDRGTELIKTYSAAEQDENGFVTLALLPSETARLTPGLYGHEAEFRFSETAVITAVEGMLEVSGDIITKEVRKDAAAD